MLIRTASDTVLNTVTHLSSSFVYIRHLGPFFVTQFEQQTWKISNEKSLSNPTAEEASAIPECFRRAVVA